MSSGDGVRARVDSFALQHEHVSGTGTARIRIAISPTTAKSTRSAATSTGCTPHRSSVATISKGTHHRPTAAMSAMFDDCRSWAGRELPHAVMMIKFPSRRENHEMLCSGETRVLRISFVPDGTVGRPGVHCVHGRQAARASTATACVRRVTTSPKTTSSSWRRKPACWTFRRNESPSRAVCSRAACFSWTRNWAASLPTKS